VARSRTATKRSRGGKANGPSGSTLWILWLVALGLLAVGAYYAYGAAQQDRRCDKLQSTVPATGTPKGYSKKDRARLDHLIDDALPAK
jgi:hypothetical protein